MVGVMNDLKPGRSVAGDLTPERCWLDGVIPVGQNVIKPLTFLQHVPFILAQSRLFDAIGEPVVHALRSVFYTGEEDQS